jgi:hypothetical protein
MLQRTDGIPRAAPHASLRRVPCGTCRAGAWANETGFVVPVFSANVHEARGYNRAARVARGKYLVIWQDDQVPPENGKWLVEMIKIFDAYPQMAIIGFNTYRQAPAQAAMAGLGSAFMHGGCVALARPSKAGACGESRERSTAARATSSAGERAGSRACLTHGTARARAGCARTWNPPTASIGRCGTRTPRRASAGRSPRWAASWVAITSLV